MVSSVQQGGRTVPYPQKRPGSAGKGFAVPGLSGAMLASASAYSLAAMQDLLGVQGLPGATARPGPAASAAEPARSFGAALDAASSFTSKDYSRYIGRSTGSGQCVALVQAASPGLGNTRTWACGDPVRGNAALKPGTVIATFNDADRYANARDGSSHAAIYLGQNEQGLQVLDQWAGSAAAVRTIPWSSPSGVAANTGSAFHVVNRAGA